MSEHSDFGIVTVLWADPVPGLQVLDVDQLWHDVVPMPGALLINLGDLTARWTNERWLSTLHRVSLPTIDGSAASRRSVAYFHDGNSDASISTITTCRDSDGSSHYEPITVADHLTTKLRGSRAGVRNSLWLREGDRIHSVRSE